MTLSAGSVFATPPTTPLLSECYFYHTLDLPGYGVVKGDWDLRGNVDRYLGQTDFRGRRVLDVGAANGFLTFAMEERGAQVIAFDLSKDYSFDIAPSRYGYDRHAAEHRQYIAAVNNGYWLAHQALGSKAQMVYGTVYDIPAAIGDVEIAVFGSILLHLRDPFLALQNALRLTRERVIIVDLLGHRPRMLQVLARLIGPYMVFAPQYKSPKAQATWWTFTPALIERFVAALGFERVRTSFHEQQFRGKPHRLFTVVADRTQPRELRRVEAGIPD